MNISKRKQGILAIICTIAMIVTSITVYNPREVKADSSATVDGKQYSATVKDGGEWTGFVCQGIFDSARIHFAWGIDVDLNTITASIGETKLKVNGKAREMNIPLSEVTSLEAGSYDIVINATTVASESAEAKKISATVTLKIEVPEETTTRDPSVVVWKNIVGGTGYSYNDNTTVGVVSVQKPEFASEQGIYMTAPGIIESISINGVDSKKYALQGGGAVVYLSGLVKGENTINIKYAGGEATVIIKNENEVTYTVTINGTKVGSAEPGDTYTLPTEAKYGYYDTVNKVIYKAGSVITVNDDVNLVSITDVSVKMYNGAAIRIDANQETPGGIRFKASVDVTCGVAEYKNEITNKVQAGTLITTKDILDAKNDVEYNVENVNNIGKVLDVKNTGWLDESTHSYSASLIKIVKANYGRYFVAKAYVEVPYKNAASEYVYSVDDSGNNCANSVERSISGVATAISNGGYDGITDDTIKSLIKSFIVTK